MFGGTAAFMAAVMTVMTPKFAESIQEVVKMGLHTILLILLGLLMFLTGLYLELLA